MRLSKSLFILIIVLGANLFIPVASAAGNNNQIIFKSFTGIYHLNRDQQGLSLLTSEETILTDFPTNSSFYGITRSIPKQYQNQTVDVKVLNVTDAAGNPVKFKTSDDNSGNLVVTTGDPSIILYGSQTFKINYQTKGVINLNKANDEFLLNVNGRGWERPFDKVNATLYIPASFQAKLTTDPICYLVFTDKTSNNCQITIQTNNDGKVITSKTGPLAAHQALVLKLQFESSTFTNNRTNNHRLVLLIGFILIAIIASSGSIYFIKKTK